MPAYGQKTGFVVKPTLIENPLYESSTSNYSYSVDGYVAGGSGTRKTDYRNVKSIGAFGNRLSINFIKTDGTLWAWGYNSSGSLGLGDAEQGSFAPGPSVQCGTYSNWDNILERSMSLLIVSKTDGTLWAWGLNASGQLGLGDTIDRSSPTQIGTSGEWKLLKSGNNGGGAVFGLKQDGTLWASGDLSGIGGMTTSYSSFIQIGSSNDWNTMFPTTLGILAIKTDGTLWSWGNELYGELCLQSQIGTYTTSSFVQIGSSTNWESCSGSTFILGSSYGVKTDGTLWTWGLNSSGQLGLGDTVNRSSPTQVGTLTNWKYPFEAGVIKTDGTAWRMKTSPVQITAANLKWESLFGTPDFLIGTGRYEETLSTQDLGDRYVSRQYLMDAYPQLVQNFGGVNPNMMFQGENSSGQLGTSSTDDVANLTQVALATYKDTLSTVELCDTYAVALTADGRIVGSGSNALFSRSSFAQIGTLSGWTQISSGLNSTLAIYGTHVEAAAAVQPAQQGKLFVAGSNSFGQLGLGNTITATSLTMLGTIHNWKQVSTSGFHSLALCGTVGGGDVVVANSSLWAWGSNQFGQLGLGNTLNRSSPVQVGTLTNWKQISAGPGHSCAIKTDGTLWSWGYNNYGQLGYVAYSYISSFSSPIQVGSLTNWDSLSIGPAFSLAIKTDGTLWSWGRNDWGQLGLGDNAVRSSPTQVGTLTNWKRAYTHIYPGGMAVKTDGTLWVWSGGSAPGPLFGQASSLNSPVQYGSLTDWDIMGQGDTSIAAIKTDGTLWMWGTNNSYGELGLGDTISVSSPTQVGTDTDWKTISEYYGASPLAIKTDGTLWAWGWNQDGQLGLGDIVSRSSPTQVGTLTNWKYVQSGAYYNLAVKTDGTLWSWGSNGAGELGLGDQVHRSSPTQVGTLTNWSKINFKRGQAVLAIKTDGTLWSWGYNNYGQLGYGNIGYYISRSSPTQVGTLTNWSIINTQDGYSLAIKTDGTLWSWGYNNYGQLGYVAYSAISSFSSPIQVGSLTTWKQVASGADFTVALKTDGTIWATGSNDLGQLGLGDIIVRSSPTQVGSLTNWKSLSVKGQTVGALRTDGTAWVWGNFNNANYSSPIQISSDKTWKTLSAGNGSIIGTLDANF